MNHHLRFKKGSARTCGSKIATVALCALALPLLNSCSTTDTKLLSVSESVPPTLARDKPFIHLKCYFLATPDDFHLLKNTEGTHVAGVYSPQDGDKLLASMKRRRDIDLLSAPTLTVRPGKSAKIESYREFLYATEYSPPQIPKNFDKQAASPNSGIFPVTPAAPTSFETKKVGVAAEFKGRKNSSNEITFELELERTTFLGFINYGSPINAPATSTFGRAVEVTITENRIEMPVFDTKRIATSFTLADGHYLAIGGLRPDSKTLERIAEKPSRGADPHASHNFIALIQVQAIEAK